MNIMQCLGKAGRYLKSRCSDAGRIDAEVLLAHCVEKDRSALYRDGLEGLTAAQQKCFELMLKKRADGEPLAYIVGRKEFMSMEFLVTPDVLIPRPETELMVEKAVEILGDYHETPFTNSELIDVGTGSGAIAVSLAFYAHVKKIYAVDISSSALDVARQNAYRHGVADKIEFYQGDLLAPLLNDSNIKAGLITANLPYIPSGEIPALMIDVRKYEPLSALDGGQDGLDFYRRLIPQAHRLLQKGGFLLMEISPGQGLTMKELMKDKWEVEIIPDLAARERLVLAGKR